MDSFLKDPTLLFLLFIAAIFITWYMRYFRRDGKLKTDENSNRLILDVLKAYGCSEEPNHFIRGTATVREIAHGVYTNGEYQKNPKNCEYLVACQLLEMERADMVRNAGTATRNPAEAVEQGRWYINWDPPID